MPRWSKADKEVIGTERVHEFMSKRNPEDDRAEYAAKKEEERKFIKDRNTDDSLWCDICNSRHVTLRVDRDPLTQKLRGLLCTSCATGLAALKDNYAYVEAAARYLRRSISYRDILCQECPCQSKEEPLQVYTVRQVLSNGQPMLVACQCKCHTKEKNAESQNRNS